MRQRFPFLALALTVLVATACSGPSGTDSAGVDGDAVAAGHHPVIVVLMDGVRVDHLGSYGAPTGSTPNLDAFAEGAVRFDWAFAQSPEAHASLASLLTGLYPTTHGLVGVDDHLVEEATTLAELASAAGLQTALFVTSGESLAGIGLEQGFEVKELGPQALESAVEWIGQRADQDFLLVVDVGSVETGTETTAEAAATYASALEALDGAVGRLFEALDGAALGERATVAVVSLSGYELGEHGEAGQASIYAPETRVPMLIRSPRVPTAGSVDKIVEVIDLGPTLLELLGEQPAPEFQGRSLVPLIEGAGTPPYVAFGESADRGEYYAALGGYRLVERGGEAPSELYDLSADPAELADIAASEENRVQVLEDHLDAWQKMVSVASLDPERRTEELDDEALEQLKSLGYIQ